MSNCPTKKLPSNEVEKWLQFLKLSQYTPVFGHNKLSSLNQCLALNRQTLELMGITLPGHLTRLERAISKLRLEKKKNSKRLSKSYENLRAELDGGCFTPSSSYHLLNSETVNAPMNRSESFPEIYGSYIPAYIPTSSPCNQLDIDYFDILSVITPVNSVTQMNGETYDTLDSSPVPAVRRFSSEEVTELDPLTNQTIVFSRNHTEPPLPVPRLTKKKASEGYSLDFPRTYDDLTNDILAHRGKTVPKIDALYSVIDEQLIEDTHSSLPLRYKPKTSDYDQLTAVTLLPTVHPDIPLLSPPKHACSLPPETLAAVGLKNPSSTLGDRHPQIAPVPAPRRSPSTPACSTKETSPKLPPRLPSQPVPHAHKQSAPLPATNPLKKTFSPGAPLLPPSSSIAPPLRHMTFASPDSSSRTYEEFLPHPTSPLKSVPNPLYIPSDTIELLRSNTSYMHMRPAPLPPLVISDGEEHLESSSSSEGEGEDTMGVLSPTKLISSLPYDANFGPSQPYKRFNTEASLQLATGCYSYNYPVG